MKAQEVSKAEIKEIKYSVAVKNLKSRKDTEIKDILIYTLECNQKHQMLKVRHLQDPLTEKEELIKVLICKMSQTRVVFKDAIKNAIREQKETKIKVEKQC